MAMYIVVTKAVGKGGEVEYWGGKHEVHDLQGSGREDLRASDVAIRCSVFESLPLRYTV
jgi:hypothetical protein